MLVSKVHVTLISRQAFITREGKISPLDSKLEHDSRSINLPSLSYFEEKDNFNGRKVRS